MVKSTEDEYVDNNSIEHTVKSWKCFCGKHCFVFAKKGYIKTSEVLTTSSASSICTSARLQLIAFGC